MQQTQFCCYHPVFLYFLQYLNSSLLQHGSFLVVYVCVFTDTPSLHAEKGYATCNTQKGETRQNLNQSLQSQIMFAVQMVKTEQLAMQVLFRFSYLKFFGLVQKLKFCHVLCVNVFSPPVLQNLHMDSAFMCDRWCSNSTAVTSHYLLAHLTCNTLKCNARHVRQM